MSRFELKMPKLGESVQEATITKWLVKVNDKVNEDDNLLEIATDKVDSEIPSPVDGTLKEILFPVNSVVPVGAVIAIIETGEADGDIEKKTTTNAPPVVLKQEPAQSTTENKSVEVSFNQLNKLQNRFFSPLVKNIAKESGISADELSSIKGSGQDGRVTKNDILSYIDTRKIGQDPATKVEIRKEEPKLVLPNQQSSLPLVEKPLVPAVFTPGDEIIEMDRMRKLIAQYMVNSKRVSPHVTGMVEADVTNMVLWRNKVKDEFEKREKTKLTFMPLFVEAIAKALRDFPLVNAQVDGEQIIVKKAINIGMAVALPSGNLIVPVIKNADRLNLSGLATEINRLADAARNNKLSPDDIKGGTFTITNFGTFRNVMGTPIINQPEVAILATGSIEKKPAVIETPTGDVIAIRHKQFLSLSYDHRVVDGMLGGMFLRRVADYLEQIELNRTI